MSRRVSRVRNAGDQYPGHQFRDWELQVCPTRRRLPSLQHDRQRDMAEGTSPAALWHRVAVGPRGWFSSAGRAGIDCPIFATDCASLQRGPSSSAPGANSTARVFSEPERPSATSSWRSFHRVRRSASTPVFSIRQREPHPDRGLHSGAAPHDLAQVLANSLPNLVR